MTDAVQNENQQEENKLIAERRSKLDHIRQSCKANGHPNDFRRDALAGDLQKEFIKLLDLPGYSCGSEPVSGRTVWGLRERTLQSPSPW